MHCSEISIGLKKARFHFEVRHTCQVVRLKVKFVLEMLLSRTVLSQRLF